MSEQPTIGKIEQLTTNTGQERIAHIHSLLGKYRDNLPPSDQRDKDELDRLRADNARLREALEDAFDYVLELSSIKRGDAQLDGYCTELAQFLDREFGIDEAAPDDKKDTP